MSNKYPTWLNWCCLATFVVLGVGFVGAFVSSDFFLVLALGFLGISVFGYTAEHYSKKRERNPDPIVKEYFEENHGRSIYPDEVAEETGLSIPTVMRSMDRLAVQKEIEPMEFLK